MSQPAPAHEGPRREAVVVGVFSARGNVGLRYAVRESWGALLNGTSPLRGLCSLPENPKQKP